MSTLKTPWQYETISRRSQTSLHAFEFVLHRGLFRGRVPAEKPTFKRRAHPADDDQRSARKKPLTAVPVASTCRIQIYPAHLIWTERARFRRNDFQPSAPGLPSTSSSYKRSRPVHQPEAMNHGPSLQGFPKKPLQQWSRFGDSRLALVNAPLRREVHRTRFASSRAVLPDLESMHPKVHRNAISRDSDWRKPCPWSAKRRADESSGSASSFSRYRLLPERRKRCQLHLWAVPSIDISCLGFRGIRSKRGSTRQQTHHGHPTRRTSPKLGGSETGRQPKPMTGNFPSES